MFGSNAYVSPAATTSWKMFQIASQSASVAGRIFILATNIVRRPLRLPQFQQLSKHQQGSKRSELLLCAPWSTLCQHRSSEILYRASQIVAGVFQPRSHDGVSITFEENLSKNPTAVQSLLHHGPK